MVRHLKDEVARTKKTVGEIRTMCAKDVRKRDVQIAKLKGFLSDRQRGASGGAASKAAIGPSCSIVGGGLSAQPRRGIAPLSRGSATSGRSTSSTHDVPVNVHDASYTLQQETNDFLTQLSQSLSDENDALINLIRHTLGTLKDIQGKSADEALSQSQQYNGHKDSGISIPPADEYATMLTPPSIESLAGDLSSNLDSLRELLSNPSFAPVEEVQVREEEIQRLRGGWEKMEHRWKDAMGMMMQWRQKMVGTGQVSDESDERGGQQWQEELNELTRGLDEVTMTLGGFEGRRKRRMSLTQDVEDESILEVGGETLAEGSQLEESQLGDETEVQDETELHCDHEEEREDKDSLLPDSSILKQHQAHDPSIAHGEEGGEDKLSNLDQDRTPRRRPSRQASIQHGDDTSRRLSIPPIPSRSPLRETTSRLNRTSNLAPPSAMKSRRSQQDLKIQPEQGLSRKVSFKHLQSPSVINAAEGDDYDELG
jgi:hypothetical protein